MASYTDEKRRRIEQFAALLRQMGLRRHKITRDHDCFIVFDETDPSGIDTPSIEVSVSLPVHCLAGGDSAAEGPDEVEPPDAEWRPAEPFRFIQFAFQRASFYLELPNNTLFPQEAEQLMQQRPGFYYARHRPDLPWVRAIWEEILEWDPLQKIYLYRDEESAAEDMAFVLFDLWKFPVDWPWYFRASSFSGVWHFEQGKRIT